MINFAFYSQVKSIITAFKLQVQNYKITFNMQVVKIKKYEIN